MLESMLAMIIITLVHSLEESAKGKKKKKKRMNDLGFLFPFIFFFLSGFVLKKKKNLSTGFFVSLSCFLD